MNEWIQLPQPTSDATDGFFLGLHSLHSTGVLNFPFQPIKMLKSQTSV